MQIPVSILLGGAVLLGLVATAPKTYDIVGSSGKIQFFQTENPKPKEGYQFFKVQRVEIQSNAGQTARVILHLADNKAVFQFPWVTLKSDSIAVWNYCRFNESNVVGTVFVVPDKNFPFEGTGIGRRQVSNLPTLEGATLSACPH